MFPELPSFRADEEFLRSLGRAGGFCDCREIDDSRGSLGDSAAGWPIFGQFVAHDITADRSNLRSLANTAELHNARSPQLNLECLYGDGPIGHPFLFRRGDPAKFLLGSDEADVVRNEEGIAVIGDPRNDENLIVVQLHAMFLRFHNAIFNTLTNRHQPIPDRFAEAQRLVRWHYQWIVLHDFLPHIVGETMAKKVLNPGGQPNLRHYRIFPPPYPFMPVEFSVAAYRFGHSMVRPSYALNQDVIGPAEGLEQARFNRIPLFTADNPRLFPRANLNGFRRIPQGWGIDWSFFFKEVPTPLPEAVRHACTSKESPVLPQPSYRIDTELVDPLGMLPGDPPPGVPKNSLALRNLRRGLALGLPSGQHIAHVLGEEPISDDVLWCGEERQWMLRRFPQFANNAPLWFYILKEAEIRREGLRLGPVGSTLVAEVFVGLVHGDHESYLWKKKDWKPELPAKKPGTFTMTDLLQFVGDISPVDGIKTVNTL